MLQPSADSTGYWLAWGLVLTGKNVNVLLSDNELRAQLGKQAMNRARSEFSWESIAERTKSKVIN